MTLSRSDTVVQLFSVAESTAGGDVSEVDELALLPFHQDALPPLLSPPSHLLPPPPRISPRCLLCPNFPSHNLSLASPEISPPSSHRLPSSSRFSLNDSDHDGEEYGADLLTCVLPPCSQRAVHCQSSFLALALTRVKCKTTAQAFVKDNPDVAITARTL